MNQVQKADALELMLDSPGWDVLYDYLVKHSTPSIIQVDGLDSLIKQAYRNGVCQGHTDVLNFIKVTIENAKRKRKQDAPDIFYSFDLKNHIKRKSN
ncbi:MAG: hypothetical protein AB7V50_08500 [Vampirovibrionia bacterium]